MIDVRAWKLPFRIGTTSYIIADDLLPNAAFLAGHVQDMQLVLFDVPGGPCNVPSPGDVAALADLGRERDLSYTVHLLEDLCLHGEDGEPSAALVKARNVIALTQPLEPSAWVCHLDGRSIRQEAQVSWQTDTATALRRVCGWAGDPWRVAVENLEGYPPGFVTPVVARTEAGRCVDVGHLWLDGVDPLPHLAAARDRLRVIHLHGVMCSGAERCDHVSLAHAAPEQVDLVLRWLLAANFGGVLTLEVFGEEDFRSSLEALGAAVARVG